MTSSYSVCVCVRACVSVRESMCVVGYTVNVCSVQFVSFSLKMCVCVLYCLRVCVCVCVCVREYVCGRVHCKHVFCTVCLSP